MAFADDYVDWGLEPSIKDVANWSDEDLLRKRAYDYCRELVTVVRVAKATPRRLINDQARAADKKLCRQVEHACAGFLQKWGGAGAFDVTVPDEGQRRVGAQLDWPVWLPEAIKGLGYERALAATCCVKAGKTPLGNRACYRYCWLIDRLMTLVATMDENLATRSGASRVRGK